MTLEHSTQALTAALGRLREAFRVLQLTVIEDRPTADGHVLADQLADAVESVIGQLEDALAAAGNAEVASVRPVDAERVTRAIGQCQQHYNKIVGDVTVLLDYEHVSNLMAIGRQRRGEWAAWVRTVRHGLEGDCRPSLWRTGEALAECWEALAERALLQGVIVNAIGQQIRVADTSQLREFT